MNTIAQLGRLAAQQMMKSAQNPSYLKDTYSGKKRALPDGSVESGLPESYESSKDPLKGFWEDQPGQHPTPYGKSSDPRFSRSTLSPSRPEQQGLLYDEGKEIKQHPQGWRLNDSVPSLGGVNTNLRERDLTAKLHAGEDPSRGVTGGNLSMGRQELNPATGLKRGPLQPGYPFPPPIDVNPG